eukprot:553212_1
MEYDNKLYELQDKIDDLRSDRNKWRDIAKKRQRERESLKHKLQTMRFEMDKLIIDKKQHKQKLESCNREKNKWKRKYQRLEHEKEVFKKRQHNLESTNNELNEKVCQWQKSTKTVKSKNVAIVSSKKNLKQQLRKSDKAKNEWESKAKQYGKDKSQLEKEKKRLKKMYEHIVNKNKKMCIRMKKIKKVPICRQNIKNCYSSNMNNLSSFQSMMCAENVATKEIIRDLMGCVTDDSNVYLPQIAKHYRF